MKFNGNNLQEGKEFLDKGSYVIEEKEGFTLIKDVSTLLKLLSYLQVGIGFFALILTGTIGPIGIIIILISLFVSWFLPPKTYKNKGYQRLWSLAAFFYLFYFLFDIAFISGSLIMAVAHLLIFIQIYKLFNRKTVKDYLHLYSLSFFQILASASLTAEVSFFIPFIFYLFNSIVLYSLINSHPRPFKNLVEDEKERGRELKILFPLATRHLSTKSFIIRKVPLGIAILLCTLLIFVLIPRFRAGYLRAGFTDTQMVSGFSDRVLLGELGKIKGNPRIVMRVQIGNRQNARRMTHWRGIGFDNFDGYSWKRSDSREYWIQRNSKGQFQVRRPMPGNELMKQVVYLEPIGSRVIFVAKEPYLISGSFTYLLYDLTDTLYLISNSTQRRSYTVYSAIPSPSSQALRRSPSRYPSDIEEKYLQLPRFFNPRIKELAQEVTTGLTSAFDKAAKIESYLRNNYTYSTEIKEADAIDPLYSFLFNSREGHCEYYATAMVMMLRSINVPSRLVNGFQRGEYNELGGYFIVRQRDAHSWTEVYFPGHGWVEFDATPEGQYSNLFQLRNPFLLSGIIDSITLAWDRYVVFYNINDQKRYLLIIKEKVDLIKNSLSQWLRGQKDYWQTIKNWRPRIRKILFLAIILPLILALAIIIPSTRKYLSRLLKRKTKRKIVESPIGFYQKMLQILRKKGIKKPNHLTPLEFVQQIAALSPQAYSAAHQLTIAYYECRYGNTELEDSQRDAIKSYLGHLKESDFSKPIK